MSSSTAAAPARSNPPRPTSPSPSSPPGSGLVGPTLFDAYRKFHPQPSPAVRAARGAAARRRAIATLFSGGYIASGTGTPDRLPTPFRPAGLRLTKVEGAGEVQTPVVGAAADGLGIGDRVWMRHAKGGELAERLTEYHLVVPGRERPTYRAGCFGHRDSPDVHAAMIGPTVLRAAVYRT